MEAKTNSSVSKSLSTPWTAAGDSVTKDGDVFSCDRSTKV